MFGLTLAKITMKKFILIVFLALTCVETYAAKAKIERDKVEHNGSRITETTDQIVYLTDNSSGKHIRVSLCLTTVKSKHNYTLRVVCTSKRFRSIEKGRMLYLKLDDGQVLELEGLDAVSQDDNYEKVSSMWLTNTYKVSAAHLKAMLEHPVVKMRVDDDYLYEDYSVTDNSFNDAILSQYNLIIKERETEKTYLYGF